MDRRRDRLLLAVSAVGVVLLIGPGLLSELGTNVLAEFACLAAACSYAFGAVLVRRLRGVPPIMVASGQLTMSTALLLPLVLLAHDPSTFRRAARLGVDLQLSGHTHGGQIWPFRYLVRLATPWVSGLYASGDAQIYVSRGTGFWGPPMRLLAPAEITEITLRTVRA